MAVAPKPTHQNSLTFLAIVGAALALVSQANAACSTPPYGSCGSNAGTTCCPDAYYCQPWDAGFFQCLPPPAQCTRQYTNVALTGNNVKTIYGIQPSACCTQCAQTTGCIAYTFINSNPGQPVCYLKGAIGNSQASVGAVSGLLNSSPTPPPTPTPTPTSTAACPIPPYGACGSSSGATCCPSGFYCQPWNPTYYQCVTPPPQCTQQLTDTTFNGNDIRTAFVNQPSECCDQCAQTAGCRAYTYINSNPGQPVCYLKSSAGSPSKLVGAVAGRLN